MFGKIADVRERTATQESVSLHACQHLFQPEIVSNSFDLISASVTSAGDTILHLHLTPMCTMGGDSGDVECRYLRRGELMDNNDE
jgi:hypothetical protein